MRTKRNHEGELVNDNRANGGGLAENATYTCSHCQRIVVINPLRTRERGYCRTCDHYVCDLCTGQPCLTFNGFLEALQEHAARGGVLTDATVREVRRKLIDG